MHCPMEQRSTTDACMDVQSLLQHHQKIWLQPYNILDVNDREINIVLISSSLTEEHCELSLPEQSRIDNGNENQNCEDDHDDDNDDEDDDDDDGGGCDDDDDDDDDDDNGDDNDNDDVGCSCDDDER